MNVLIDFIKTEGNGEGQKCAKRDHSRRHPSNKKVEHGAHPLSFLYILPVLRIWTLT
jgi:hypothetical protein